MALLSLYEILTQSWPFPQEGKANQQCSYEHIIQSPNATQVAYIHPSILREGKRMGKYSCINERKSQWSCCGKRKLQTFISKKVLRLHGSRLTFFYNAFSWVWIVLAKNEVGYWPNPDLSLKKERQIISVLTNT